MPCLITPLTRSATKKATRKNKQQNKRKQKIHGKNSLSKIQAPSNNLKMQSDKTLTTHT